MQLTPRAVEGLVQSAQPDADTDIELADHDLWFICAYLGAARNQRYSLEERPDERVRTSAAPDYLLREEPSGRAIAVEHARFMNEDLQRAKARALRGGADLVIVGPQAVDPVLIGNALSQFLVRKLERKQTYFVEADERMVVVRNRVLASDQTFLRATLNIPDSTVEAADRCFLIAWRRLFVLW